MRAGWCGPAGTTDRIPCREGRGEERMSVIRVLVGHPDERVARTGRLFVVTTAVLAAAVLVLATYGRTWSWSGFRGNENVWEWLDLLAQPIAIVALLVQLVSPVRPRRWLVLFGA